MGWVALPLISSPRRTQTRKKRALRAERITLRTCTFFCLCGHVTFHVHLSCHLCLCSSTCLPKPKYCRETFETFGSEVYDFCRDDSSVHEHHFSMYIRIFTRLSVQGVRDLSWVLLPTLRLLDATLFTFTQVVCSLRCAMASDCCYDCKYLSDSTFNDGR